MTRLFKRLKYYHGKFAHVLTNIKHYGYEYFVYLIKNRIFKLKYDPCEIIRPRNLLHTPIFINNFNRLKSLKLLLTKLYDYNFTNIIILDNKSTYLPLLEYYRHVDCHICRLNKNYGHLSLWESNQFNKIINTTPFILTDSDVVPDKNSPADFIDLFYSILEEDSSLAKVGFSLRIDDLPDTYNRKNDEIKWESKFWKVNYRDTSHYLAPIDTTFALYRPKIKPFQKEWWNCVRTNYPYVARHMPWYQDSNHLSEEELFYKKTALPWITHFK